MKKKQKIPQPTVTPKDTSDLELFQAEHGADWQRITTHPAFLAGLQLLKVRAFNEITSLSFEDIEKYGLLILSVLIGRLKTESDMMKLHEERTFTFPTEEELIYMSPEQESEQARLRQRVGQ